MVAEHRGTHVFVNRRKVELHTNEFTGAQLLAAAGFEGPHWDLFRLQGKQDTTGTLVTASERLTTGDGEFFRVVPGHQSFEHRSTG